MDKVNAQTRSKVMSKVRSTETSLEILFRKKLWKQGIRYRKNNKKLFGKPDISIMNKKTVLFIDSCFWHGCPQHLRMPSSNISYWKSKIDRNRKRDEEVNKHYRSLGWIIFRVWEHELRDEISSQNVISYIVQGLQT